MGFLQLQTGDYLLLVDDLSKIIREIMIMGQRFRRGLLLGVW